MLIHMLKRPVRGWLEHFAVWNQQEVAPSALYIS